MEIKTLKIGYWPYRMDLKSPGDRRRFCFYSKKRGVNFTVADIAQEYDILYLTFGCNISDWINYKKKFPKTKIVFELIDSFLFEEYGLHSLFRGIIKYIIGKESRLSFNYKKLVFDIITMADAVVCSSIDQLEILKKYNKNIHISLDYFSEDITYIKQDFTNTNKLKLVWEGQAYTVKNLLELNPVFKRFKDKVELHVITDPKISYPFKIFDRTAISILSNLKCDWYFHEWKKDTFSKLIAESDLAIIPISKNNRLMWYKPANKLLLLWEIGIPVLTSDTPAYLNVNEVAGLHMYCKSSKEWEEQLLKYLQASPLERESISNKATTYLLKEHNEDLILQNWDKIFSSLNSA